MRFLFVDRILNSSKGKTIQGIKHITSDDHYLSSDENGRYYFPTSLIGETLGQLAAWNVMEHLDFAKRPVAGVVASAKLVRRAFVGETLLLESIIDSLDESSVHYHSIARVGDEVVFTIDGALGPLLPMTDFIDIESARRQFTLINRPGAWPVNTPSSFDPIFKKIQRVNSSMTFDALLTSESGVQLSAVKYINYAAPYFPDHFPRKPVLPLTILLECKLNLAREFIDRAHFATPYQAVEMRRIKMNDFVLPGDILICYVKVKRQDEHELVLSFRSEVEGKRVCVMELVLR